MQRYAPLIGVKPAGVAVYERLHANTWPELLATILRGWEIGDGGCGMRGYTSEEMRDT